MLYYVSAGSKQDEKKGRKLNKLTLPCGGEWFAPLITDL